MTAGRRIQYSLEELKERINNYFNNCDANELPYTISDLAISLGVNRSTLLRWEKSEPMFVNMNEDEIAEFCNTVKMAKARCEAYAERYLFTAKNPAGVIFNLKNNYNWVDKQEISSTIEQKTSPIASLSKEELLRIAYSDEDNDN